MADQMLTTSEAITRGLHADPFVFTEVTHLVPEEARTYGQRSYESRWFFAIVTEVESPAGYDLTWLSMRRNDRQPLRDWRHLQKIKNALCGPEREAVELYPAESRLMDASNQTHLWVLPEGEMFPWGYAERDVLTAREAAALTSTGRGVGARQRPFSDEEEAASRPLHELNVDMRTSTIHKPKFTKETR